VILTALVQELLFAAAPTLVWGLVTRSLGLVFAIAFASLGSQIVALAGRRGVAPVAELHAAMRRDFPAPMRWLYFPSLLWLSDDDRWLGALPWIGFAAAVSIVIGGPHTPIAFFVCWLVLLSLDRAAVLVYPWDSLLLEAGFWAMALPALAPLPDVSAVGAPAPALTWLFRLFLFRVMFGFGKQKFVGSTRSDAGFLHGFFIRQPLPTPLGWWAHHLPMPVHVLALAIMFVIEMILPFGVFVPGPASVVFLIATVGLMIAIQLVGNFGHFNVLTIALALCLLDHETPWQLDLAHYFDPALPVSRLALHGLVALHTIGVLLSLPLNTWASFTWTTWAFWRRIRPGVLTWPIRLFRALQPLRWLHPYGVFPPRAAPPVRMAPELQLSFDGETWLSVDFPVWPTHERFAPRVVAPHHLRIDQSIVYEAAGFEESGPLRGLTGRWDPYGHARISGAGRLVVGLLENRPAAWSFVRHGLAAVAARSTKPVAARAPLYMLEPTTPSDWRASARHGTHRWWRRTLVASHLDAVRLGDPHLDPSPPPPERWAIDDVVWLSRSVLGPLMKRARHGEDLHTLVLARGDDLTPADVERLWDEVVPSLADADVAGWSDLSDRVAALRERWSAVERDRLERLIGRYVVLFVARFEPFLERGGIAAILGLHPGPLPFHNHEHVARLARHVMLQGRTHFDALLADPDLAKTRLPEVTLRSGTYLHALFNLETLRHHARKTRMLAAQLEVRGRPSPRPRAATITAWGGGIARRLWSSFEWLDLLRDVLRDDDAAVGGAASEIGPETGAAGHVANGDGSASGRIRERFPRFVLEGLRLRVDDDARSERGHSRHPE
jgi:hypothetical protein